MEELTNQVIQTNFASSLWTQKGYEIETSFVDSVKTVFNEPVNSLDFKNKPSESVEIINNWVSGKTQGKIPVIITPEQVSAHLITATLKNDVETVSLLISVGADVNLKSSKDGLTPLMVAETTIPTPVRPVDPCSWIKREHSASDPSYLNQRGLTEYDSANYTRAACWFELALKRLEETGRTEEPLTVEVLENLAKTYEAMGKPEDAAVYVTGLLSSESV